MTFYHYSATPLVLDHARTYEQPAAHFKPVGLWLSVDEDWKRWCDAEDFNAEALVHRTQVDVGTANLLVIDNVEALDAFTARYRLRGMEYEALRAIDWPRVKSLYDGIVIAPYLWERRLAEHTFWYYTWDCASACVWNVAALSVVQHSGASA